MFALLARAIIQGAISCFSLVLGMAVSDIIYLVLACFGLSVIAEHWGGFFTVVRIAGAIYLIYLGWAVYRYAQLLTRHVNMPCSRRSIPAL